MTASPPIWRGFPPTRSAIPVTTLTNDALVPVFATKVRRHARQLDLPDASVEIAFDEGTIEAGARQEVLSEIELELKSGNAGVLFDLGTQLLDAAPLRVGTRSKAERGFALAFDVVQPAAKAELSGIAAEHVVDDVIARLVGSCWHHLLKNHAVAEKGIGPRRRAPDARRLAPVADDLCAVPARYSVACISGGQQRSAVADAAARPGAGLGRFRRDDRHSPGRGGSGCRPRRPARGGRTAAQIELRRAAARSRRCRCGRFLLSLGHLVERRGWRNEIDSEALAVLSQPMPALADKILTRLHRKALRRGAHFRQLNTGAQHDLRIDLKKLRYAAELFSPLYATQAPAKRYVSRLATLQSSLGRARDIAGTRSLLDAIRQDDQPALQLAIGAVAGWQARDRIAVAKTLRRRWRRFKATQAFWSR